MAFIRTILIAAACVGGVTIHTFAGEIIIGLGQTIDGDTLKVGDKIISLAEVDAPELAPKCEGGPKGLHRCGVHVADLLRERLQQDEVHCDVREMDQYDRRIASCTQGNDDLLAWLVQGGWALAYREYSDRLVRAENEARQQRLGLWQTSFEPPWTLRAKRSNVAMQQAPAGCPIKGNSARDDEHIYHTPWGS